MATKIEIINLALSMLSANLLSSTGDDSDEARLANLHYDPARDATLEAQEWSFAIKRFQPAKTDEAPLYGYGNAFTVPSEILRVVACDRVTNPPSGLMQDISVYQPEQIDWVMEKRLILTDEDVVYARGIERITAEGQFSPLFVHAFAAKLAVLMAYTLTQSNQIMQNAAALYEQFIAEAKSRDGLQGRSRRIRQKQLLRSR